MSLELAEFGDFFEQVYRVANELGDVFGGLVGEGDGFFPGAALGRGGAVDRLAGGFSPLIDDVLNVVEAGDEHHAIAKRFVAVAQGLELREDGSVMGIE